ncbi:MAG: hypothetical protein WCF16_11645, partial [Alphaproteobacteria bacterium]
MALAAIAGLAILAAAGIFALSDRQSSEEGPPGAPRPALGTGAQMAAGAGDEAGAGAEDEKRGFEPVAPPRPLPALDLTDAAGQPAGL